MMKFAAIWLASANFALPSIAAAQLPTQDAAPRGPLFAPADPASVGIDRQWLEELGRVVQGYVEADRIVGAELLVIKNDATVFHQGFGSKHREEAVPMTPGGIFCVRSMTKAVAGTAVQILIDERKLSLGDRVSKYLPSFDNDRSRKITVEQLLTHTGGLPLSSLITKDIRTLTSIREVADITGDKGPEFTPGEAFHYSDDGADTLGALVEIVSGKSLADFLAERIFVPLEMRETIAVVSPDQPLRDRVCSAYAGSPGAWVRILGPKDPPIFPVLLASQGLYCSALDYARFLHLWKQNGFQGPQKILSAKAVRRALEPGRSMDYPTGFEGLEAQYGQLMQLWVDPHRATKTSEKKAGAKEKADDARVVAFGHGGSDGTHAWVFPELDLMVLYFTQSRGNTTGLEIEKDIQRLLLDPLLGEKRAPMVSYSKDELGQFLGLYSGAQGIEYCAVILRGDVLTVEFPGLAFVDLEPTRKRDSFDFKVAAGMGLDFSRAESGAVEAALKRAKGEPERMDRIAPKSDLISVDALMELKQHAVNWEKIADVGKLCTHATLEIPAAKVKASIVGHSHGLGRLKTEMDFGNRKARITLDGERGWVWNSGTGLEELSGERLNALHFDHHLVPIADWRKLYAKVSVLAKSDWNGEEAWVVRAEPRHGNAHTWYVSTQSGLPLALLAIGPVPGVGDIGVITEYADWRDVGAIRLPYHRFGEYATPLLGHFDVVIESIEPNAPVDDSVFALESADTAK